MLTYEDARDVVMAADQGEFTLWDYAGGPQDLDYLKDWVLGQVETIYKVSADVFNQATVYSTSILRDFVNRALYQTMTPDDLSVIEANGEQQYPLNQDVAGMFRYPAYGACALMAWQEYQVFRAFGYLTHDISTINGDIGALNSPIPNVYTDGHVTTDVYVVDYDKYIIQDATFNFLFEDNGIPLSYQEVRSSLYSGGSFDFDSFNVYTYYSSSGAPTATLSDTTKDLLQEQYFKVPLWSFAPNGIIGAHSYVLFRDPDTAHDPASNQGLTFGQASDAERAIANYSTAKLGWTSIAHSLSASGYYVSGFALANDTQDVISHWITVRLNNGNYLSFDLDHHIELNGSYDQLANEATGGPDINPGHDLSDFLRPAYLLDTSGNTMDEFVPDPGAHIAEFGDLVLLNTNTGMIKLWDMPDTPSLNAGQTLLSTTDTGFKVAGYGDYGGDYGHDILFQKAATGQVGFVDGAAHWNNLGNMPAGWEIASSDDHSDFTGNGSDDILWHNQSSSGDIGFWSIVNGQNAGYVKLDGVNPTQWHVIGTNDFNGDGSDDILWQNAAGNTVLEWLIHDGTKVANNILTNSATASVVAIADISHDGSADIIWENKTTGEVGYWDMLNGQSTGYHSLGIANTDWSIAAVRDMTADGTPDIVWQDPSYHLTMWNLDHAADATPIVVAQYIGAHASDWIVA